MNVKTRFAPSPTGSLHIGNIRTALYAWLFARNQGGKFILRIEDTNPHHNNDAVIKNIITVMQWLRLDWDEGPYFQSHRLDRYNDVINDMLKHRLAYKCYCSPERLETLRLNQIKNKKKPKYDGYCRMRSMISCNNFNDNTVPYVVRFCNPIDGCITFHDQIRGIITFHNQELDDLIICRANGIPTYNFCVVVDDIDMNITHIIRGEEHINNTPRQINIIKALNASIPIYAHVPMVLGDNKQKLSKRCKTSGVINYRDDGFLPEAVLNYLIRLGWSHGNQEIFDVEQMKNFFCLNKISKASSTLNFEKLLWLNRYYIKNLPTNYIIECLSQYIHIHDINFKNGLNLMHAVELFSKRCSTLKEILCSYMNLYKDFNIFEQQIIAKKYLTPDMIYPLKGLKSKLDNMNHWALDTIQNVMIEIMKEFQISMNTIGMAVRIALIGTHKSPNINIVMYTLGKYRVLYRIDQAISYIKEDIA